LEALARFGTSAQAADTVTLGVVVALALCVLITSVYFWRVGAPAWMPRLVWPDARSSEARHASPEPAGLGTRYPIVLVHGLMGFDQLKLGGAAHEYFRGVVEHLGALGIEVHRARLPPVGSIKERALALHAFVTSLEAPRVNLIAHSMGGLDARYAIRHLGLDARVASLVTIGTPHHGTPLANVGSMVVQTLRIVGLRADALEDLSESESADFNRETPNVPGVFYGSVIASTERVHPMLVPVRKWLAERAGPNDGLVPASSQEWGVVLDRFETDHWGSVGWFSPFEARAMYFKLVHALRARGL
jgi:triacylglycerol lipase